MHLLAEVSTTISNSLGRSFFNLTTSGLRMFGLRMVHKTLEISFIVAVSSFERSGVGVMKTNDDCFVG